MRKKIALFLFAFCLISKIYSQINKTETPNWVEKVEYQKNPKIDESLIEKGLFSLLYEHQINEQLDEYYYRQVTKITENVGVQSGSSVNVLYDPSYQKLFFHSIFVIRDGKLIDKLNPSDFQVIRRELNSENYIYDGTLSAMCNLSDIRVGDILEYSYTIKGSNPIYKSNFFYSFYLNNSEPLAKIYLSILTDKNFNIHYLNTSKEFKKQKKNNLNYYFFSNDNIKTVEYDIQAPSWNVQFEMAFISEFKNWKEVVDWGIKVFDVNKQLSKELTNKISEIDKSYKTSGEKIKASLQFVQDDIRYLGLESGIGAYEPFSSNKVFSQRYGDCKDKSLLLVTMLNKMGIEAYPMLVNTYLKETITELPPSPIVFDHCVVKVTDKEGGDLFYDPTISNQGGNFDVVSFPDYRYGLVLKKDVSEIEELYSLSNNNVEVSDFYELEEIGKGATLKTKTVYFDDEADFMRTYFKNNSINSIKKEYEEFYATYFYNIKTKEPLKYEDDRTKNRFITYETYEIDSIWQPSIEDNQIIASFYPYVIINNLTMPQKRERNLPFALPYPITRTHKIDIKLPQKWNINKDSYIINSPNIFYDFDVTYKENEDLLSITHILKTQKDNVSVDEFSTFYDNIKKIDTNIAYSLIIPKNYATKKDSNWLQYFGMFLFIIIFILAILCAFKVYEYDPEPKIEKYFEKNKSISGWLIIVAIGLCLSPFRILFDFFSNDATLINGSWIQYLNPNSGYYNFSLGLVIFIELIINIFLFVFLILHIFLFFNKRSSFPKLYSFTLIGLLVFIILDTLIVNSIIGVETDLKESTEILRSFIYTGIVVSYLLLSDNVKETFVKTLKQRED